MAKQGEHGISWCEETWNPIRGCTRVSDGCRFCYAERQAARFSGPGQSYEGLVRSTSLGPQWTGKIRLVEEHLNDPLRWRKPRRIFVNSMSDLFHPGVPDGFLLRIVEVMLLAPQHTYQVLTKRPDRMRDALMRWAHGGIKITRARHIWFGVSVEDQATADERIPLLLETPAAVRWVSYEPALGPIDFRSWMVFDGDYERAEWNLTRYGASQPLSWIVAGGESGPGARPAHPAWFRQVRDQCGQASIPFHFKQQGDWLHAGQIYYDHPLWRYTMRADDRHNWDDGSVSYRVGKRSVGRLLDGRVWDEFPEEGRA